MYRARTKRRILEGCPKGTVLQLSRTITIRLFNGCGFVLLLRQGKIEHGYKSMPISFLVFKYYDNT
jgi:hypothetical protein